MTSETRICKREGCSKPLPEGAVSQRRYCTIKCQRMAQYARSAGNKYPVGIQKLCTECGDSFQTDKGRGARRSRCSYKCDAAYLRKYNRMKKREERARKRQAVPALDSR